MKNFRFKLFCLLLLSIGWGTHALETPPNADLQYRPYEKFKVSLDNLTPAEVLIHQVLQQEPLRAPITKRDPQTPEIATCTALEALLGISYRNRYLGQKNVILDLGPYHIINLPFEDRFRGQHVLAIYKGDRFDRPETSLISLSFDLDYNFLTSIRFNDNLKAEVSALITYGRGQKIALFKFLDEVFQFSHHHPYGSQIDLASFLPLPAPPEAAVIAQRGSITAFYTIPQTRQGRQRPVITLRWKHPTTGRLEDLFSLEFSPQGQLTRITQESFNFSPSFLATVAQVITQENAAYAVVARSLGLNYQPEFFGRWDREAPLAFAKRAFVRYWQEHPPVFLNPLSHVLSDQGQNAFKTLLGQNAFTVLGLDPAQAQELIETAMARKERIILKTYKKNIALEYLPADEVFERSDLELKAPLQEGGRIIVHKQGIQFDGIQIDLAPDQTTIKNIFYKKQNSPAILKRFLHKSAPVALQDLATKLAAIIYQATPAAIEEMAAQAETNYAPTCTLQRAINDHYGRAETERFIRQLAASLRQPASVRCPDNLVKRVFSPKSSSKRPKRFTFKTNSFEDLGLKID